MQKFYDLTFSRQPDGSIRLMQSDCGEDYIINLHPAQLRHVAESFGLVAPTYPADELSKRLAEQLCAAYLALTDEQRYWSPRLESLWERLDAQVDCLPDELFPHHLWERRQETESKAKAAKEASAVACQQSPCRADEAAGNALMPENEVGTIGEQQMGLAI